MSSETLTKSGISVFRAQRMRRWLVMQLKTVPKTMERIISDFIDNQPAKIRSAKRMQRLIHREKRLVRQPLIPVSFAAAKVIEDPLLMRWATLFIAENERLQVCLSSHLAGRLLSFGISRALQDYDMPGPWTVVLLGLLLEKDPQSIVVWQRMLSFIGEPHPSDATFLGLFLQDDLFAQLKLHLKGISEADDKAQTLIELAQAIHSFTFKTPVTHFPFSDLSKAWFNQAANRGLRRHRARMLGIKTPIQNLAAWPAWLTWKDGEQCPRALAWMGAEWFLSMLYMRSVAERRSLLKTLHQQGTPETEEDSEQSHEFRIPDPLLHLCKHTQQGDDISNWVHRVIESLVGSELPEKVIITHDTHTRLSTIGRRGRRYQGESL